MSESDVDGASAKGKLLSDDRPKRKPGEGLQPGDIITTTWQIVGVDSAEHDGDPVTLQRVNEAHSAMPKHAVFTDKDGEHWVYKQALEGYGRIVGVEDDSGKAWCFECAHDEISRAGEAAFATHMYCKVWPDHRADYERGNRVGAAKVSP